MKKENFFKRVLAGLLGLMLVMQGVIPVMASETPDSVKNLAVREMTEDGFVFSYSPVSDEFDVYCEYSANKNFDPQKADIVELDYDNILYYSYLEPGITYYVRAYAANYDDSSIRGAYSNVVQVKAPVAEVTDISTEISAQSIKLTMVAYYGIYTGFRIDRKEGNGKYQNLTTTVASRFTDKGLKKNTKYTYRVCAYAYNASKGKTVYGDYNYVTVETGTAAMNLKAHLSGENAVKLTWKKIPSAAGYDVYRWIGTSYSNTVKPGVDGYFNKYEFVKRLSRKKTSYTDKKLSAGTYNYYVRAYKFVNGRKVYFVEDTAGARVSAKFSMDSSVDVYKEAQNPANGKVSIAWYPVPQAKGYLIEKYDDIKGEWVTHKKITKAATRSYTLPASKLGTTVWYRVRAYSGNKYSQSSGVIVVDGHIAAVTGVKAKATANGIQISWKKVNGASYYSVYRTTDPIATYYADTKTYQDSGENSDVVQICAFKKAGTEDEDYYTLGNGKTKMQVDYDAIDNLEYHSPYNEYDFYEDTKIVGTSVTDYVYDYHTPDYDDEGNVTGEEVIPNGLKKDVTYHYYVIAYKEVKDSNTYEYRTADSYGYSKLVSAKFSSKEGKTAPAIQKVKAGKNSVTITIRKVAGAKKYLIYRSASKKKGYKLAGSTAKTSYKDKKLTSKKTYYYKVRAVSKNSLGEDVISSFSKVKSAKAK